MNFVSFYLVESYGLPLLLSELGTNARLNLIYEQYRKEIVAEYFGARDPFLTLTPNWKGLPPQIPHSK